MIPDCQKRFNAAYQDLKSIVDEDVSVHDARCVGFYSFQFLKRMEMFINFLLLCAILIKLSETFLLHRS